MKTINPATGTIEAEIADHTPEQMEARIQAAHDAQVRWATTPLAERTVVLTRVAAVLRDGVDEYARLITLEMGKPLPEARAEVLKCATCCDHYAAEAETYLAPVEIASNATQSSVVFDPLGVVLAVMPWNYPFWQFIRFAAPALAAGNAALLKHASNVPQCAMALEDLFTKAGSPEGLVGTLLVGAGRVEGLIADDRIAAVTLTGSTEVGRIVAAQAGAEIKKQVLELGGSDPFIVLADADVEAAAEVGVRARFQNGGQSCIAAKRFVVMDSVADAFVEVFVARAAALKQGDPFEAGIDIGPMARPSLRDELAVQVERTVAAGATLRLGGIRPDGPGAFYPPTVLDHVTEDHPAFREETFGPCATIVRAKDEEDAIRLANATEFGLGAAIWSSDIDRASRLARRVNAGAVFINGIVASDPRLPFGGIGKSGYGRELGEWGIREFTNTKTVWVGPAR
jgi:succinate-semialdehyde dehydrogenase / glutarate-semialdehyde dehydrogenase